MTTITIDRSVVEQALEALEDLADCGAEAWSEQRPCVQIGREAITVLRAALAEPVQEPVEMQDIGSEWKACVKLPVTVHVRAQRPGETHISTREGITPCRPDDLIMRGVAGEEYPIGRELFKRTYRLGTALVEPQSTHSADCYQWHHKCAIAEVERLRDALAEPVQEPAAWRTFDGEGGYDFRTYEDNEDYAAEWAKRNPRHVGWVEPLYTTPPQRKENT